MILFLCPHGGAKSVMAAAWFNREAEQRGLSIRAEAAAAEDPYEEVPEPVRAWLAAEGIEVTSFRPRRVSPAELKTASRVIAIGCDLPSDDIEYWNDVPMISTDLAGAAESIRRHVETLVQGISIDLTV